MDSREREKEKRIGLLELENEELDQEVSKAQKEATIAEAKRLHGKDWKKILLGAVRSVRINKEALHTLHGMGINSSLKDYNDPRHFPKPRRGRTTEEVFKE